MGTPPAYRKVRRECDFWGLAPAHAGTRRRHLGMVRGPHAEDLTQPSVHRNGAERLAPVSAPCGHAVQHQYCQWSATLGGTRQLGVEKVDAGSTTRRAAVGSPRSRLKIESPNAREGACVITRTPTAKTQGQLAAAMAQLYRTRRVWPGISQGDLQRPSAISAPCGGASDGLCEIFICLFASVYFALHYIRV